MYVWVLMPGMLPMRVDNLIYNVKLQDSLPSMAKENSSPLLTAAKYPDSSNCAA